MIDFQYSALVQSGIIKIIEIKRDKTMEEKIILPQNTRLMGGSAWFYRRRPRCLLPHALSEFGRDPNGEPPTSHR